LASERTSENAIAQLIGGILGVALLGIFPAMLAGVIYAAVTVSPGYAALSIIPLLYIGAMIGAPLGY
jgi:hypothetical protein